MDKAFQPRYNAFEQKVRDSFSRQDIMHTLGATLDTVNPGKVEIRLPFQQHITQQHGFVHGGVVATVLDSACGYAALSLMGEQDGILSIEFKVNFLAPAQGETFIAIGQVRKPGRTISVCEADFLALGDEQRKLIATMTATMMSVATQGAF